MEGPAITNRRRSPATVPAMTAYNTGGAPVPQQAQSTLRLYVQGSILTNSMLPPKAVINGTPVPVAYGSNDIPVYPGPIHIDMSCQWLRTYGQAAIDVNVEPGQLLQVFYAAPFHQFARGNIGLTKQKHKGLGFLIGLIAFIFLMVFISVAAVIFS